jgi:transposase
LGITCGIDWAEAHHDVALVDVVGTTVAKCRIDTGLPGFTALMALIAEHSDEPDSVPVAIETDKNLIVAALQAAGLTVYAINPRAVARYRERSAQAGGKSDPGDAIVLANILRTDLAMHRALPRISEGALAVKALARQHQEAIWARQLTVTACGRRWSSSIPRPCRRSPCSPTRLRSRSSAPPRRRRTA